MFSERVSVHVAGTLSGTINTAGSVFVTDGTLALSGTNTLTGPMEFRGSSVSINSSNVFGSAAGSRCRVGTWLRRLARGETVSASATLEGNPTFAGDLAARAVDEDEVRAAGDRVVRPRGRRHHDLDGALGDVPLDAPDEPHVRVGVHVDPHVEELAQLRLGVDEDAVHEDHLLAG